MNKLGRPHIPNATYQVPRSLAFWFLRRRFLNGFYHIWAWRPSWSCDQEHLNKLSFHHPKESPYEIWVQLTQWFQRRRCLKMLTDGRRTDAGVTGILIAHLWAFGSGELITVKRAKWPWITHISFVSSFFTICLLGNFAYFNVVFWFFFQNQLFHKFFQEWNRQSIKQYGSDLGPNCLQKLSADVQSKHSSLMFNQLTQVFMQSIE